MINIIIGWTVICACVAAVALNAGYIYGIYKAELRAEIEQREAEREQRENKRRFADIVRQGKTI